MRIFKYQEIFLEIASKPMQILNQPPHVIGPLPFGTRHNKQRVNWPRRAMTNAHGYSTWWLSIIETSRKHLIVPPIGKSGSRKNEISAVRWQMSYYCRNNNFTGSGSV